MEECKSCGTHMALVIWLLNNKTCYRCQYIKETALWLHKELKGQYSRLDCRKALMKSDCDVEKAKEWLKNMDTSGRLITRGRKDLNGD